MGMWWVSPVDLTVEASALQSESVFFGLRVRVRNGLKVL
jgi:hypothetical protein